MKIILVGAEGKMGRTLIEIMPEKHTIIQKVDKDNSDEFFDKNSKIADVLIDFSAPELTERVVEYGVLTSTPLVIATTGQSADDKELIIEASKFVPIFYSSNTSFGIASIIAFAKKIIAEYPTAEIDLIESHHNQKADVPSGTALTIANELNKIKNGNVIVGVTPAKRKPEDVVIHSLRKGNDFGVHEIIITAPDETFLIKHTALDRKLFGKGAIKGAEFIVTRKSGLYDANDLYRLW